MRQSEDYETRLTVGEQPPFLQAIHSQLCAGSAREDATFGMSDFMAVPSQSQSASALFLSKRLVSFNSIQMRGCLFSQIKLALIGHGPGRQGAQLARTWVAGQLNAVEELQTLGIVNADERAR
jgi:hypothetical protein